MQRSVVISAAGHAGVLALAVVTFAVKPYQGAPQDSLPVEIVSAAEFSQVMAGSRDAPQAPTPKPRVEKVADPTPPTDDPAAKLTDKPEIKTASAGDPPPLPEAKPEPQPKPDPAEAKKPEPKVDPIAEALKKEKEEAKKTAEKKVESKPAPKQPPKPQAKPQPKFDPKQVAALLDKRAPQRHAVTGQVINTTASLGLPNARAAALSQSEIDALRAQIQACWNPPVGAAEDPSLVVKVRLQLHQDGTLSAEPVLVNRGTGLFQITAESALRAIKRCQPFKLPAAKYEVWRDVEVTFDPRDMLRG